MKTQLSVFFVLFVLGCRQCATDGLAPFDSSWYSGLGAGGGGLTDSTGIFAPRIASADLVNPSGLLSQSLDSSAYLSQSDVSAGGSLARSSYVMGYPVRNPIANAIAAIENFLARVAYAVKNSLFFFFAVTQKLLYIPIGIIKFLLLPVRITFALIKFGFKLLFLPITIMWNITKILLYPIRVLLRRLFSTPPPPYVIGVPTGSPVPPVYASSYIQ